MSRQSVSKNSVEAEMIWVEVGPRFRSALKSINYTSGATLWQKNSFVVEVTFKGYLRYKTIFYRKVAFDV